MAWTSNWLMVRATCSEVNFIAQSFRLGSSCYNAQRCGFTRCVAPPQGGQMLVDFPPRPTRCVLERAANPEPNYTSRAGTLRGFRVAACRPHTNPTLLFLF